MNNWGFLLRVYFFFCCGSATQRGSWPPHSWGFLDHTQRRTTVGRTPLDEWSARRRDLYLTTYNTHNRQTPMPPGEIRTYDLSRRAATGTGVECTLLVLIFVMELKSLVSFWPRRDSIKPSSTLLYSVQLFSCDTKKCTVWYIQIQVDIAATCFVVIMPSSLRSTPRCKTYYNIIDYKNNSYCICRSSWGWRHARTCSSDIRLYLCISKGAFFGVMNEQFNYVKMHGIDNVIIMV